MSPIRTVAIRGDGTAARCCAHLLARFGFHVALEPVDRPRVPAIMIGDAAAALIRDVFQMPTIPDRQPRVTSRIVAWGQGSETRLLAHSACVISEDELLANLGTPPESSCISEPDFTIYGAGNLPGDAAQQAFGSRRASASRVRIAGAEPNASYIESLENGWLFLVPGNFSTAWLLAIGASVELQLAQSRVIAPLIGDVTVARGSFPCCPRIATPLCGPGWLSCGSAALAFDPICGDGTAHAVREAILACAVIRGIANGGDQDAMLAHYQTRLLAGMQRHVALCGDFYLTGGTSEWWKSELESLGEGFRWCTAQLAQAPPPRYRLRDFELESIW